MRGVPRPALAETQGRECECVVHQLPQRSRFIPSHTALTPPPVCSAAIATCTPIRRTRRRLAACWPPAIPLRSDQTPASAATKTRYTPAIRSWRSPAKSANSKIWTKKRCSKRRRQQQQEISGLKADGETRLYVGLAQGAIVGLAVGAVAAWIVGRRIKIVEVGRHQRREERAMSKKKQRVTLELNRRDFLVLAGTAAGSIVAAQVLTTGVLSPFGGLKQRQVTGDAAPEKASSEYHWGMVINLEKCIGCEYCQRACSATNDVARRQAVEHRRRRSDWRTARPSSSAARACTARMRRASKCARCRRPTIAKMVWS